MLARRSALMSLPSFSRFCGRSSAPLSPASPGMRVLFARISSLCARIPAAPLPLVPRKCASHSPTQATSHGWRQRGARWRTLRLTPCNGPWALTQPTSPFLRQAAAARTRDIDQHHEAALVSHLLGTAKAAGRVACTLPSCTCSPARRTATASVIAAAAGATFLRTIRCLLT